MSRGLSRGSVAGTVAALAAGVGLVGGIAHQLAAESRSLRGRVHAATVQLLADRALVLESLADSVAAELNAGRRDPADTVASLPAGPFGRHLLSTARFSARAGEAEEALDPAVLGSASFRRAAVAATDRGAAVAAVVAGPRSPGELLVVWPLYTGALPLRTAERRTAQAGWAVASVRPEWLVAPATSTATTLGFRPAKPSLRPAEPGAVHTVAADAVTLRLGSQGPSSSWLPWALLALLAGTALTATSLVLRLRASRTRAQAEVESLREQIRLLADLGVTAQETLDVSLTLPALLLQLSTRLHLDHVAVLSGSEPHLVELLALGDKPSAAMTLRFPLQRSLRTIGALEISRSWPISTTERETVQAIADVIAGSLFNSELFEREQAAVQQLQDVDRLKDNFLGTVSHELRTPLSILVGYSAMLRKRWSTMAEPDKLTAVTIIETHVGALTNLVNDLLDFVTDRDRAQQVYLVSLRLALPVRELVERYAPLLDKHELQCDLDAALEVRTDPRAVERILTNLLSNAAKYSPPGSVITVSVTRAPDGVELGVVDQGPGIADEERALIFERFYRGTTDAARSTRGTGIGLTIVKTWMELVGARLEVRSRVGVGTRVSVVFPQSEQALDDAGRVVWREEHPTAAVRTTS